MSSLSFKLILYRPQGIGIIIDNFIRNKFSPNYKHTVGVGVLTKEVNYREGKIARLTIWDLEISHRFEYLKKNFYEGTHGALTFFDLTSKETYERAKNIFEGVKEVNDPVPFLLIGDKIHLDQLDNSNGTAVLSEEARDFARNEGGIYIEITPDQVDLLEKAIHELTCRIVDKINLPIQGI